MNKKLAGWATSALAVVGAVLVGAFFVSWINDGTSGLSLAWHEEHWLFLVPISGALLAATASAKSEHTRIAAVVAGLLVAGDLCFEMLRGMLHGGLDLWLMLGGAIAVLAGAGTKQRVLAAGGGIAILVGFIAPWTSQALFSTLTSDSAELAAALGINIKILWLIPAAGIAAIVASGMADTRGRNLALVSGIAVFGSILWMIGSVANLVFAWGAWATLGASAIALVLGLTAPAQKSGTPANV
jgi:hypothetical protein